MTDQLFSSDEQPVVKATRLLRKHGIVAVPATVIAQVMTTLYILECDADSEEERESVRAVIRDIEQARDCLP